MLTFAQILKEDQGHGLQWEGAVSCKLYLSIYLSSFSERHMRCLNVYGKNVVEEGNSQNFEQSRESWKNSEGINS